MQKIKAKDLKLGDVVELGNGPWMTAIVRKIDKSSPLGFVTFYRPYGHSDDFGYGDPAQVICLTGVETFSRFGGDEEFEVWERKEVK